MKEQKNIRVHRSERLLAYLVMSSIALSISCFLAVIIGTAMGIRDFATGIWPAIALLPLFGLPAGMILLITLLALSGFRRSQENKEGR